MIEWFETSKIVAEEYGTQVDYEEEFFICPECGESIYAEDWEDYENWDKCPICEFNFKEVEQT